MKNLGHCRAYAPFQHRTARRQTCPAPGRRFRAGSACTRASCWSARRSRSCTAHTQTRRQCCRTKATQSEATERTRKCKLTHDKQGISGCASGAESSRAAAGRRQVKQPKASPAYLSGFAERAGGRAARGRVAARLAARALRQARAARKRTGAAAREEGIERRAEVKRREEERSADQDGRGQGQQARKIEKTDWVRLAGFSHPFRDPCVPGETCRGADSAVVAPAAARV